MPLLQQISSHFSSQQWNYLERWANGPLARLSIGIPLFGYLILFNDELATILKFTYVTGEKDTFFLSPDTRLQLLYFGLVFLAVATAWYNWRKPMVLHQATSQVAYAEYAIANYPIIDLIEIYKLVDEHSSQPLTAYWTFGEKDLEKFIFDAEGQQKNGGAFNPSLANNREVALNKNGEFLRSMLIEFFRQQVGERKTEQVFLMLLSLSGFTMLSIPSLDFFVSVVLAAFS